jgi:HTH-type transcriptional regulator/antitoxin HipB
MSDGDHHLDVNDVAVGRALRAIRLHLGLRQADVAMKAGVAQQLVSRIERGDCGRMSRRTVGRVLEAVGADVVTIVRWRGGHLDRLLDEQHAVLVGLTADLLRRHGWQVLTEVTYAELGERGSVDILAWHGPTRRLLVVEIKTEIASAEELLRRHDEKVRLGPKLARDRFGAAPRSVTRLLVLADRTANRTRLARLEASVGATYPARGRALRDWIADASATAPMHGLLILRERDRARRGGGVKRVNRASALQ